MTPNLAAVDHNHLFAIGGQPVNVAMAAGAICAIVGLLRCWTRGRRDPAWDAPTRLRHDAGGARIFGNWMWVWALAVVGGAFYWNDAFMFVQASAPAFVLYACHKKEAILEQQALQVEAFLNGDRADGPLSPRKVQQLAKGQQ